MLGEVLSIRGQESRPTLSVFAESFQQVHPHRVELPEIDNHLVKAEIHARRVEILSINPGGPNRAANVGWL
jgi:hypothetical protein